MQGPAADPSAYNYAAARSIHRSLMAAVITSNIKDHWCDSERRCCAQLGHAACRAGNGGSLWQSYPGAATTLVLFLAAQTLPLIKKLDLFAGGARRTGKPFACCCSATQLGSRLQLRMTSR
jgi:hypothetical protein